MRLLIGRAALGAGEHERAVKALAGLAAELPTVQREITGWYAEAAAIAGPHEEGAKLLSKSARVRDLILAAQAFQRAGKAAEARQTIDRALQRAARLRRGADEVAARMAHAAMAEQMGQKAVALAEWLWVVKQHPDEPAARAALAGIHRLEGQVSIEVELAALAETTSHDNLSDTLARYEELAKTHKSELANIALAKARSFYQVRSNPEAVKAFDEAAKLITPYRAEALYFAARSAEREGELEGALQRHQQVISRFIKSGWAERSAFQKGQLLLQLGRFADAAQAWTQYLSRFAESKWAREARLAHALALLASGKAKLAKEALVALRNDPASNRSFQAELRELEGLAALRAGDLKQAEAIWLELVREQPLTFPALAAHARLRQLGHEPLPPLIGPAEAATQAELVVPMPPGPALLHSLGLDEAAERMLERVEQDLAQRYPNREGEALCALYRPLSTAARLQRIGNRSASLEQLMRPPTAVDRWAWSCVYPRPYAGRVRQAEARYEVPHGLAHAIMRQESAFRPRIVSPAGAIGLMQLMPNTAVHAAAECKLPFSPEDAYRADVNLYLGTFYIGKLLKSFGGSVPLAIAAYNAGPHAVQRWLTAPKEREVDLWVARIPYDETRNYVMQVLANFARYQYLGGGVDAVTPLALDLPTEVDIGDDAY